MEKIKLIKPLWRNPIDSVIEVSKIRAEFAKRKGFAIDYVEEKPKQKAEKADYKNKAEKAPKKNK